MIARVGPGNERLHYGNSRMRFNWVYYLILLVGIVFVYSFFAVDPAVHCVEYPCPAWLRAMILGLGLVFGLGVLIAMIRDHQSGSYLDPHAKEIVWWDSCPPLKYKKISIDDIKGIDVDTTGECDTVVLLLWGDREVSLPSHCIHTPYREWCRSVSSINSSIEVRIR